jgi:hypothetical protein
MNKKTELKVKPVKRYRKPKYPSHDDPDPTLHPQPIPYPGSRKIISALTASAGLVASASCTPSASPVADGASLQENSSEPSESEVLTEEVPVVAVDPFGGTGPAVESQPLDPFTGEAALSDPFAGANPFPQASDADDPFGDHPVANNHPVDAAPPAGGVAFGGADEVPPEQSSRDGSSGGPAQFSEEEFAELQQLIEQTIVPDQWDQLGLPVHPGQPGAQSKTVEQAISKSGGNPLCVALSGLPHHSSGFGTGLPNYVEADLARRVIERAFRGAGYNLRKHHQYDRDGVAMVLDGYDPDKKVGFVVVDWQNLDNDAILNWWAPPAQNDGKKYEAEINSLLQTISQDPARRDLVKDIRAAKKLADPARRSIAFKAILDKHRRGLLSLQEFKKFEQRAKSKQEYVAVISTFDRRFAHPMYPSLTPTEQAEIGRIADPGKRQAATRAALEKKAAVAIEALEKAAREYIQWAQRQGLN